MRETIKLSKFKINRIVGETNYASDESLIESIKTMKAVWNIPILQYLKDLMDGSVDSVSFTKDKPYYYFFGRRFKKSISITIKEDEKTIEFSIPLEEVNKIITS